MRERADNPDLARWLHWATLGLCESARRRIAGEIESHYADAFDAGLREGITAEEAHQTTMFSLGDVDEAKRKFRRTYLTEDEAERLRRMDTRRLSPAWRRRNAVLMPVCVTGFSLYLLFRWEPLPLFLLRVALVGVVMVGSARLIPHLTRRKQWRRAAFWHVFFVIALILGIELGSEQMSEHALIAFATVLLFPLAFFSPPLFIKLLRPSSVIDLDMSGEKDRPPDCPSD
jgi:hypothetical protein